MLKRVAEMDIERYVIYFFLLGCGFHGEFSIRGHVFLRRNKTQISVKFEEKKLFFPRKFKMWLVCMNITQTLLAGNSNT